MMIDDPPSPFVTEWVPRLRALAGDGRALDLAMGRGRHALPLARAGFATFGVDIRHDAVRDATARARQEGFVIRAWCADLTRSEPPASAFEVVLVTRYLQRTL